MSHCPVGRRLPAAEGVRSCSPSCCRRPSPGEARANRRFCVTSVPTSHCASARSGSLGRAGQRGTGCSGSGSSVRHQLRSPGFGLQPGTLRRLPGCLRAVIVGSWRIPLARFRALRRGEERQGVEPQRGRRGRTHSSPASKRSLTLGIGNGFAKRVKVETKWQLVGPSGWAIDIKTEVGVGRYVRRRARYHGPGAEAGLPAAGPAQCAGSFSRS